MIVQSTEYRVQGRNNSLGRLDWLTLDCRIVSADGNIKRTAGMLPQVHRGLGLLGPAAGVEVVTI